MKREKSVKKQESGLKPVILPAPCIDKGKSVMTALRGRKTTREISGKNISMQTLSDLLWAACGVNRKKGPFGIQGRTAGSASNSQEIDVYVFLRVGAYRYVPENHSLEPAAAGDLRAMAIGRGQGKAGADAPVRLVYIADIDKFKLAGFQEPGLNDPEIQKAYYYVDMGMIAENVYLFAASRGLSAWFHNCDKQGLTSKLGLRPHQRALFGQTIGYKK